MKKTLFILSFLFVMSCNVNAQGWIDMGPGSIGWYYQQQQMLNATKYQQQQAYQQYQEYLRQQSIQQQQMMQRAWQNMPQGGWNIPPQAPWYYATPQEGTSAEGHRSCYNCGGQGFIVKQMYHGFNRYTTSKRRCGVCNGRGIIK